MLLQLQTLPIKGVSRRNLPTETVVMTRKTSSKHSWRKRLSIIGLVLFTLYLCFGIWAVPAIMISQIESKGSEVLGREIQVDRASFNPFSLEAKLYDLSIGPREGDTKDLLSLGKLSLNPQISSAFGTITLKSIEVSEGDIWIEKTSSGEFIFQDIIDAQVSTVETSEPASDELPAAILHDLLVTDLQLHFTDSSLATPYEETIVVELLQGRDIGTVEKSSVGSSGTDTPRFHWDFDGKITTASGAGLQLAGGATSITPWGFEVSTSLQGFPLNSVQPYVDESVVAEVDGIFGFELVEKVLLSDSGLEATVSGGVSLDTFSAKDDSQAFAVLESLRIGGLDLDASSMEVSIDTIEILSPAFESILLSDGTPRLPVMKSGETPAPEVAERSDSDFKVAINSIVLSNGQIQLEDRSLQEPFKTKIEGIEMSLNNLAAAQNGDAYDSSGELDLAMKVLGGDLQVKAGIESLQGLANASVSISGIQLPELQPYASEHMHAELQEGVFNLELEAALMGLKDPSVTGALGIHNLKLREDNTEKEIAAITSLEIDGVDFSGEALSIQKISVVEPLLAAWQDDAGINLQRIAKLEAQVEQKAESIEEDSGLRVSIDRFEVTSAGAGFVDTTLVSTHNSQISDFDLSVDTISTDPGVIASFEFAGVVDGSARIAGNGKTTFADPSSHLDLDMSFRGYDLTSTSPYWATYLGRKLSKGQFEIISHYEVRDNQLEGTNDFKIDQLTLGEKVESDRAINLPLGFAIKLMQDPSGMIAYEGLPVEGDLADPQVKPWGLIGRAFRNLMLNAVASPFKFLAKMAGGREDLDSVAFAIGTVEVDQEGLGKVSAIQKLMGSRPGLNLEVTYLADPAETQYLEGQYAMHLLANPEFQVVSGLDLLRPIDRDALGNAVHERYSILAERPQEESEVGVANIANMPSEDLPEAEVPDASSKEPNKGLVKRLAGVLRIGKKDGDVSTVPVATTEVESAAAPDAEVSGEADLPSLEEMLDVVLAAQERAEFNENWIGDLSAERIRSFKAALLASDQIDGSRVFTAEVKETGAKGTLGSVLIRLSE